MGNNSSLYLQNYTLNLIATDLHGMLYEKM